MPGTFVIDTGGVVRFRGGLIQFAHRSKHEADSPANDDILRVVACFVGRAQDDIALAGDGGPEPQPRLSANRRRRKEARAENAVRASWLERRVPSHPFSTGAPTSEPYSVHEPS
jgi:hypothetical protein